MLRDLRRRPRASRSVRAVVAAAALGVLAAACGIKGPLKLPEAVPTAAPPAAGSPPTANPGDRADPAKPK